jgi:hypothetical protein
MKRLIKDQKKNHPKIASVFSRKYILSFIEKDRCHYYYDFPFALSLRI